ERLLRSCIALDRLHRALAEEVGHIANAIDRHLLLVERHWRLAAVIKIVGIAAENSEEVVVAALERTEVGQIAEVPFADQRGAVARFLENRRQRRVARRQADA